MVRHPVLAFEPEPAHMAGVWLLPGVGELVSVQVVHVAEHFPANVTADVPPGPLSLAAVVQGEASV